MNLKSGNPALVLIDIQKGLDETAFYGGTRNNLQAEQRAAHLLQQWRALGLPVFHIRHSSLNLASPLHPSKDGFSFKDEVKPIAGEAVITKNVNSAFIGTNLMEGLERARTQTVVLAGLTTNHCVSSTARMAGNLGLTTYVVSDATAAFKSKDIEGKVISAETIHAAALASLHEEFATVLDTEAVLEMLKS